MYCQPCMLLFEPIFTPFVSYHSFPPTSYYRTILFLTSKVELWCRYFVTHFQYLWFLRRTDFRTISFLPTFYPLSVCHSPLTLFDTMYLNTFNTVPYLLTYVSTDSLKCPIIINCIAILPVNVSLLFCISLWTSSRLFMKKERNQYYPLPRLRWKRWIANQSDFLGPCSERSNTPVFIFIFYSFFFSNLWSNVRRFKKASFPLSFQNFHGDCGHGRHGRIPIYRPKPYHQDSIALKSKWF